MIGTILTWAVAVVAVAVAVIETRRRNRKIRHLSGLCERVGLVLVDYYDNGKDIQVQVEPDDGRLDQKDARILALALLLRVTPPPKGGLL